ncbi:MAG: FHA domain-containing protein [Actinomycetota bacterium]
MPAYLEVWRPTGPELVALDAERVTVGKAPTNDVPIASDRTASRLHAVFERYQAGWCVRDLGSRNGTFVNGQRIWSEHTLYAGDEVRVGKTRLVYRPDGSLSPLTVTEAAEGVPDLTRREGEILLALCRPVLTGDVFTEPASIRQIAEVLVVTEAAIKQHLAHLYDKFGIHEDGERRRVRLANEAVRRGAVTIADLRAERSPGTST